MEYAASDRWDVGEAIAQGWKRFWPNILPMALFAVVVWGVSFLLQLLQPDEAGAFAAFVVNALRFLVGQLIAIGWIALALDITDGRPISADRIVSRFRVIVPYLIAAVLFSLMVSVGLVLLIVPGIIVILVFGFYGFHIVDTGQTNPIAALSRSMELTRGHRLQLLLLGLLLVLINIVGVLLLIVGVLFTSGISLLAVAYVYRQLSPVRSLS